MRVNKHTDQSRTRGNECDLDLFFVTVFIIKGEGKKKRDTGPKGRWEPFEKRVVYTQRKD